MNAERLERFRTLRRLEDLRAARNGPVTAALAGPVPIEGVVALEGKPTGDGRTFDDGSLFWEDDPIPIIWDPQNNDHDGMVVGTFTTLRRRRDGTIFGEGELSETDVREVADAVNRVTELIRDSAIQFSVRVDSVAVELRISKEAFEEVEQEEDDEGRITVAKFRHDDLMEVMTEARIRHVALVDTAALIDARPDTFKPRVAGVTVAGVSLDDPRMVVRFSGGADPSDFQFPCPNPFESFEECVAGVEGEPGVDDPEALCTAWEDACEGDDEASDEATLDAVLAAFEVPVLPAAHFPAPADRWQSSDPQPWQVEDDGRFWGHVVQRGVCHRSRQAGCQTYQDDADPDLVGFHGKGTVTLDDGRKVRVGSITMGANHADKTMTAAERRRYHEDNSTVAAIVVAWEDRHGLAVSGHMVDGLSDREVQQFLGSAPSVELWPHDTQPGLTLLGVHMVPTEAWPVAAAADDGPVILVSGPCPEGCECPDCGRKPALEVTS